MVLDHSSDEGWFRLWGGRGGGVLNPISLFLFIATQPFILFYSSLLLMVVVPIEQMFYGVVALGNGGVYAAVALSNGGVYGGCDEGLVVVCDC